MELTPLHLVSNTQGTLGLDPIVTVLAVGWFGVITAAIWRRRNAREDSADDNARGNTPRRNNRHSR